MEGQGKGVRVPAAAVVAAGESGESTRQVVKKIIVRIKGGLGNQLFCYAAARRLAVANEAQLVIDAVTGFVRDRAYRRRYALEHFHISARKATPAERLEPFERYRRGLAKLHARRTPWERRRYLEQEGVDFDPRLLAFRGEGTVYLDGLWQSEHYFREVEPLVREDLRILPPADPCNREMARRISACEAVAVHVRWFGDPQAAPAEHNLGASYYARAVAEIRARVTKAHFFLFSDRPEASRSMLNLAEEEVTCLTHNRGDENAYADLWLMTQCKHFVIANSTFSWWGAWLGQQPGGMVIAPGALWTGLAGRPPAGLIPARWLQLS